MRSTGRFRCNTLEGSRRPCGPSRITDGNGNLSGGRRERSLQPHDRRGAEPVGQAHLLVGDPCRRHRGGGGPARAEPARRRDRFRPGRSMAGDTPGAGSFGLGAGLWWLVSNLLALAAGGYTAAWLAGNTLRFDGMLHGIVTWGVTLLLTFYLLTTAIGGLIGGAFTMVGGVSLGCASAAGEGLRAAAPQVAAMTSVTPEQMLEQAKAYLQPANPDPAGDDAGSRAKGARHGDAQAGRRWRPGQAGPRADRRHHGGPAADQPGGCGQALRRCPGAAGRAKNEAMQTAKVAADARRRARPPRRRSWRSSPWCWALLPQRSAARWPYSAASRSSVRSAAVGSAEIGRRGGWPRGLPASAFAHPTRAPLGRS